MSNLSIENINKVAPYQVENNDKEFYFDFKTDNGVRYSIGFDKDDLISCSKSYQLIILNVNHRVSPRDHKVRDTIIAIIDEFFRVNNITMLYICETNDGKQKMRSRLFEYWFSTYSRKANFTLLSSSVTEDDGTVNFTTIIIRNDNPDLSKVVQEFTESVKLLNQKPE